MGSVRTSHDERVRNLRVLVGHFYEPSLLYFTLCEKHRPHRACVARSELERIVSGVSVRSASQVVERTALSVLSVIA